MTNLFIFMLDTIVINEPAQDAVSMAAIIESVLERIKMELPELRRLWVVTDNATC